MRIQEEYVVSADCKRQDRIAKSIFFCNAEETRLARRFVSSVFNQIDATFGKNRLHLPLTVLVGIANIEKNFPFGHCFVTSESAATFEWMDEITYRILLLRLCYPRGLRWRLRLRIRSGNGGGGYSAGSGGGAERGGTKKGLLSAALRVARGGSYLKEFNQSRKVLKREEGGTN